MQPIGKVEKMSKEFFKNSTVEFLWSSSRILIRILVENFRENTSDDLSNLIRILFGNEVAYFLSEFQQEKEYLKNYAVICFIRILQKLDDCGILMEFFKNFDQNTSGKF